MYFKRFEDLDCWKLSRTFTKEIYQLSSSGNLAKDFGLKHQLQRASVSIMLNIAEGFSAGSSKSFMIFVRYSYRSASEVKAILYIAFDLNYIDENSFNILFKKIERIQQTLGGLLNYLKNRK